MLSDTLSYVHDLKINGIDPDNPEPYYEMKSCNMPTKMKYYRATILYTKAIHRLGVESRYYVTDDYGAQMSNHKILPYVPSAI